jgi:hypothetical protein
MELLSTDTIQPSLHVGWPKTVEKLQLASIICARKLLPPDIVLGL